jgi:hypothetical protein
VLIDLKKRRVLLLIAAMTTALVAIAIIAVIRKLPEHRLYIAHHGLEVIIGDDVFHPGYSTVQGFWSNDMSQLATFLCSREYLEEEFERTRDINTFAILYRVTHNGLLDTDVLRDMLSSGKAKSYAHPDAKFLP